MSPRASYLPSTHPCISPLPWWSRLTDWQPPAQGAWLQAWEPSFAPGPVPLTHPIQPLPTSCQFYASSTYSFTLIAFLYRLLCARDCSSKATMLLSPVSIHFSQPAPPMPSFEPPPSFSWIITSPPSSDSLSISPTTPAVIFPMSKPDPLSCLKAVSGYSKLINISYKPPAASLTFCSPKGLLMAIAA